jgi:hypothetical protein
MTPSIQYASYLVRLWREVGDEQPKTAVDWHGEVEHIQSGLRWTFDTFDDMLDFLRQGAQDTDFIRFAAEGQGGMGDAS